ncbi:MAG: DUF3810 domain-containing protein [Wujia sp.]
MKKAYKRYIIIVSVMVVVLNMIAWLSRSFCDGYIKYVFPIWINTYCRFTGLFPFSVGEIMVVLATIIFVAAIIIGVLFLFLRKKEGFKAFAKHFYKCFLAIFVTVCMIMTLNCTLLYHCTRIDPNENMPNREYSLQELEILYDYVVTKCNYYADRMQRDENGYVVYDQDMKEQSIQEMNQLSKVYSRLKGYYPRVKDMMFSDLMSQSYIAGYYFPFSLEANVNSNMYIVNFPATYCHELSHLRGYIYEDEANFLAYLACIESEDDFFCYSGYMSVLSYIEEAYSNAVYELSSEERAERLAERVQQSDWIYQDFCFLLPETWDEVNESAIIDTETVSEINYNFTDTSLKLNGVSEGMAAYDGVVGLLLQYYDGILY